ncbi:MAG: hypothetical protein ABI680_01745 [Chthoniobacteraceae bacterium]
MNTPKTQRLLDRVSGRHFVTLLASRFYRASIIAAGVGLAFVLIARLLGLLPNDWIPVALGVVAAAAVVFPWLVTRRPDARQAARLVDAGTKSKDLFLTTAALESSSAAYEPIVIEQAEQRAEQIEPAMVVPFRWQRGVRDIACACAVVAVAVLWLPQLDPFRKEEERNKTARERDRLEQTKKATAIRAAEIKEADSRESDEIKKALAALDKTFKQTKPEEREKNLQDIAKHQKELGAMWRQAANKRKNDAFAQGAQQFGAMNPQQINHWREELKKGDVTPIKKEIGAIKKAMQDLAKMPESAEKRAAQEKLAQRLGELAEGMKQAANSPEMQAALQRAMEQMDMAKLGEMSKESMQAAIDSLNLSQEELDKLAQSMKDLENLQDALKNLQMARRLAGQCQLDGSQCKDCDGMADYEALFSKLMNGHSDRFGPGMGRNPGHGAGGKAPENDETETAFQPEKSPTQLSGGKMLLQWKVKEEGPTGARAEDYRAAVREVQQGVSEAIANEQVPPGYHDAIQRYFDTLPEAQTAAAPVPAQP